MVREDDQFAGAMLRALRDQYRRQHRDHMLIVMVEQRLLVARTACDDAQACIDFLVQFRARAADLREIRQQPAHLRIVGQFLRRSAPVARQPVQGEIALALLLDQAVNIGLRALDPVRINRILDAYEALFVEFRGERGGIQPTVRSAMMTSKRDLRWTARPRARTYPC